MFDIYSKQLDMRSRMLWAYSYVLDHGNLHIFAWENFNFLILTRVDWKLFWHPLQQNKLDKNNLKASFLIKQSFA
jgi:hypothetical protein